MNEAENEADEEPAVYGDACEIVDDEEIDEVADALDEQQDD